MDKEQIEQIIHEYIKNNLNLSIDKTREHGYGGEMETWTTVRVYLGNEEIYNQSV